MTAVIKSGDPVRTDQVRALALQPRPVRPSPEALRISELEAALHLALEREEGLQASLTRLEAEQAEALRLARSEGEDAGRKAADDQAAALAVTVGDALDRALSDFHEQLDRLTESAGFLAGVALQRIVGDAPDRGALVAEAVRRASVEIFGDNAVRLEVSRADFPDETRLRALIVPTHCEVRVSDALESGACIVQLKLGRVDLGLDGQVARLRTELAGGVET